MTLQPDPGSLGLESPTIGPWFSATSLTLPVPGDDLGVSITLPAGTDWLPPATGLLSFAVATDPRPPLLGRLHAPDGGPAFTTGRLVAVFRLLPEVEARLASLLANLPTLDGSTPPAGTPTRAAVRWFALELPESPPTLTNLKQRIQPAMDSAITDPARQAENLGLAVNADNLSNLAAPIAQLFRPGQTLGSSDTLLMFPGSDVTAKLFAFDDHGRAIDPGAVAAWWASLAGTFNTLWAQGISGADQRTAAVADQLTVALAGPNEGPVAAGVLKRLTAANLIPATGAVRKLDSTGTAVAISFTGGAADDAPLPRVAVLPAGSYAATANLWPSGAVGGLKRDFVRLGLVDLELHLTGQPRVAEAGASDAATRRATDQRRATSRILVGQATTAATDTVLLPTADQAVGALVTVLGLGNATLVAPVLDRAAGALAVPALPAVDPPAQLPNPVTMVALTGGGTAQGQTVSNQRVLVQTSVDPSLAGAWLRVWPQYFDFDTGRHVRGAGGSGTVDATGTVRAVVRLADGAVAPDNLMGLDVMLVTASQAMRYTEVRLERPAPIGGTPVALSAVTGQLVACETGQGFTGSIPAGSLASGSTLVALTDPPALIDPTSLANSLWDARTIAAVLAAGDTVWLTEPAWKGWRGGEDATALGSTGATVTAIGRTGLTRLARIGSPLPTQARDEVAAAVVTSTVADSVVAALTPLGVHHELLPHQSGHPGTPGDDERHGTGARLRGPAAVAVAEILRERTAGDTVSLAIAAATPLPQPTAPTVPGSWAAVLRTVGFGVEAEPGLVQALNLVGAGGFPFDGSFADLQTWLTGKGIPIPASAGQAAASVVRAVSRRMLGARSGYREAAQAMLNAIGQAEDYLYLETPALDTLTIGNGDDALGLLTAITQRASANTGLQVLLCLPVRLSVGTPAKLQRVRDQALRQALDALKAAFGERLAVFSPVTGPGRSLLLDATTVLVDDAWAVTGGAHLWRRGLSFDSSLSVSVFDERVAGGRPSEIVAFRRALLAGRLGLPATLLPEDAAELVRAIRQLSDRGGGLRLSPEPIATPDPVPSADDLAIWLTDGSPTGDFDAMGWLQGLAVAVQGEFATEVPGTLP